MERTQLYPRSLGIGRPDVDVIIQEAVASGRGPDQDDLEAAKIRFKQRIRARVARELAKEEWR